MQNQRQIKRLRLCALLFLFLAAGWLFLHTQTVSAAGDLITIKSCTLTRNGRNLNIKATVGAKKAEMGKNLYLLALDSYEKDSGVLAAKPVEVVRAKKGTITFSVKYKPEMLCQQFVVAYKKGGKYKIASNASYITNPEVLATYTGKGAATYSKKGVQPDYGEVNDPLALGAQHVLLNWTINEMFRTVHTKNTITYKYRGKYYYFDQDVMNYHDSLVKQYVASGARVYVILLLQYGVSKDTASMCYGASDAAFSSVNVTNQRGCLTWEALMTYLGERYSTEDNLVSGWVLGNEVDSPGNWNYGGGKSLGAYMADYATAFRICHNAVRSKSKNTNVYISLDYNWNYDADGGGNAYFTTKATLDAFYSKLKSKGKINFRIAYHAYSQGLREPAFWDDFDTSNDIGSKIITMNNIHVLTNYVKDRFGKNCTIMLAEQSFNANWGEDLQAATFAYAYYLSEANSMIESFVYGREFDTEKENNENFFWGLSDKNRNRRLIWNVFKYIDCRESFQYTNSLVKRTNISSWTKIKGLKSKVSRFPKIQRPCAQPAITDFGYDSATSIRLNWTGVTGCDGYQIYRDGKRIAVVGSGESSYVDRDLEMGQRYVYKVRAYKKIANYDFSGTLKTIFGNFSEEREWIVPEVKSGMYMLEMEEMPYGTQESAFGGERYGQPIYHDR